MRFSQNTISKMVLFRISIGFLLFWRTTHRSIVRAFTPPHSSSFLKYSTHRHHATPLKEEENDWDVVLSFRLNQLRRQTLEEEFASQHPTPMGCIETCLARLWHNDTPSPDAGLRYLLRRSTKQWRQQILSSVGAPLHENAASYTTAERVVTALRAAMTHPDNQYALLLPNDDNDNNSEEEEEEEPRYRAVFPSEPLIFTDDHGRTAWVECQLRSIDHEDDRLLVTMGWQLRQDDFDDWRIERIDWQDFREPFRPGVGREEWMRICG